MRKSETAKPDQGCISASAHRIDSVSGARNVPRHSVQVEQSCRKIFGVDKIEPLLTGIPFRDGTPVTESAPAPQSLVACMLPHPRTPESTIALP
jgi:hypothetical protein